MRRGSSSMTIFSHIQLNETNDEEERAQTEKERFGCFSIVTLCSLQQQSTLTMYGTLSH
jgi:hypothetical protein